MLHPLVKQLHFTRSELMRCIAGVTDSEARQRFASMNSISWIVAHLAVQENDYWVYRAQGKIIEPELRELAGFGRPASTPPLEEARLAWQHITNTADEYLSTLTPETLLMTMQWDGKTARENIGTMLYRNIYHYWFHLGEAYAIRQLLGHTGLPSFVGDMSQSSYSRD